MIGSEDVTPFAGPGEVTLRWMWIFFASESHTEASSSSASALTRLHLSRGHALANTMTFIRDASNLVTAGEILACSYLLTSCLDLCRHLG